MHSILFFLWSADHSSKESYRVCLNRFRNPIGRPRSDNWLLCHRKKVFFRVSLLTVIVIINYYVIIFFMNTKWIFGIENFGNFLTSWVAANCWRMAMFQVTQSEPKLSLTDLCQCHQGWRAWVSSVITLFHMSWEKMECYSISTLIMNIPYHTFVFRIFWKSINLFLLFTHRVVDMCLWYDCS
jgi:hypothetical protein